MYSDPHLPAPLTHPSQKPCTTQIYGSDKTQVRTCTPPHRNHTHSCNVPQALNRAVSVKHRLVQNSSRQNVSPPAITLICIFQTTVAVQHRPGNCFLKCTLPLELKNHSLFPCVRTFACTFLISSARSDGDETNPHDDGSETNPTRSLHLSSRGHNLSPFPFKSLQCISIFFSTCCSRACLPRKTA